MNKYDFDTKGTWLKSQFDKATTTNCLIAALTALIIAIGLWAFPLIGDDLASIIYVKDTFLHGEPFDLNAYADNIRDIYATNHFRLPNLLMPVVILLPKWIPATISCLSIYYILRNGSRAGNFDRSWKGMLFFASAFILLFPWMDQLYLVSFQAPYLWGTAFSLMLIKTVLTPQKRSVVLPSLGAVLLGFWLEAYAGAVLGACVCLMLFRPEFRNRRIAAISIALACGITIDAMPLITQGKWTHWDFFAERMSAIYPFVFVNLLYAVMSTLMLRKYKSAVLTPTNLTLLEIAIASAVMTIYFKTGTRVNGLGSVCSLIGIIYLLRQIPISKTPAVRYLAILLGTFAACHIVTVDTLCYRLKHQTEYVIDQYRHHYKLPVFAPLTLRQNAPALALQKPYFDWFAHTEPLRTFNRIYGNDSLLLEVVPEQLQNFSPEKAEKIPGNAGILYYDGYLVAPDAMTRTYRADYGNGPKLILFHIATIKTIGDTEYTWMYPNYTSLEFIINPRPTRIDHR